MNAAPLPAAYLHEPTGAVHLWVHSDAGAATGAIVRRELLHYRFGGDLTGSDALQTYLIHREVIDAAVRRRIAAGSLEPVLLREHDFGAQGRPPLPR